MISAALTASTTITHNQRNMPVALVLSGAVPATPHVGDYWEFTPQWSSPELLTVAFSASNQPSWATLDTATGKLYGTATSGLFGNITLSATGSLDGNQVASASLAPFDLNVVVADVTLNSVTATVSSQVVSLIFSTPVTFLAPTKGVTIIKTKVALGSVPTYSAGTTYAITNNVVLNGMYYESVQNGNTGHAPNSDPAHTWWKPAYIQDRITDWSTTNGSSPGVSCNQYDYTLSASSFVGGDILTVALNNIVETPLGYYSLQGNGVAPTLPDVPSTWTAISEYDNPFNGTTSPNGNKQYGKHPGHTANLVDGVQGVVGTYYHRDLEPTYRTYNFSSIISDLNAMQAVGKKLYISVPSRHYWGKSTLTWNQALNSPTIVVTPNTNTTANKYNTTTYENTHRNRGKPYFVFAGTSHPDPGFYTVSVAGTTGNGFSLDVGSYTGAARSGTVVDFSFCPFPDYMLPTPATSADELASVASAEVFPAVSNSNVGWVSAPWQAAWLTDTAALYAAMLDPAVGIVNHPAFAGIFGGETAHGINGSGNYAKTFHQYVGTQDGNNLTAYSRNLLALGKTWALKAPRAQSWWQVNQLGSSSEVSAFSAACARFGIGMHTPDILAVLSPNLFSQFPYPQFYAQFGAQLLAGCLETDSFRDPTAAGATTYRTMLQQRYFATLTTVDSRAATSHQCLGMNMIFFQPVTGQPNNWNDAPVVGSLAKTIIDDVPGASWHFNLATESVFLAKRTTDKLLVASGTVSGIAA